MENMTEASIASLRESIKVLAEEIAQEAFCKDNSASLKRKAVELQRRCSKLECQEWIHKKKEMDKELIM